LKRKDGKGGRIDFGGGEWKVEDSSRMDGWIVVCSAISVGDSCVFVFLLVANGGANGVSCHVRCISQVCLFCPTRYTATRNHNSMDTGDIS
jgi:hypothetical protein